ncbi:MAG TPA: C25 family cysteine peptidase [Cyclobacteriaceae bacterium]|nr:C25 family cysteine peptidase [Cyclobacteriaceae bacterium]
MRMRHWAFLLLFTCLSSACFAQYTNDWVSYNQPYYKISVATTGIYRLTYDQLQQAGVPVNSIDPRLIQVYHRGKEQAIYFKHDQSPADSKFDATEFLEFYGQRNDGTLDAALYQPASLQPHKYYNLFSDTTAYFLTVNTQPVQGKRMDVFDQVNNTGLPKETAHTAERLSVYTSEYSTGDIVNDFIQQSYFDEGEGWTGATICTINTGCAGIEQRDFTIDQVVNTVTSLPPPILEVQLTGRDRLEHMAEIYAGPGVGSLQLITTRSFTNFQTPVVTANLDWSNVGADGKIVVRVKGLGVNGTRERLSVAYIKITFPQGFDMASGTTRTFTLNAGAKYIELSNPVPGTRLWDITDPSAPVMISTRQPGAVLTAMVPTGPTAKKIYASGTFLTPDIAKIKTVTFREMNPLANYIIVSHPALMHPALDYGNPVESFAAYRASEQGGSYVPLVVTSGELYDQFNYGETSPLAIREFMRYMIAVGDPQYLFLIGKGRDATAGIHHRAPATNESPDLVPTAGHPGSDMAFTAGLGTDQFVPAVATGRLTATTPTQVAAYLNKVKTNESTAFDDLWRKKILHLSGGIRPNELVLFRGFMDGFANIAKDDFLGGQVITLGKHGLADVEPINVSKEINAGLDLITFFGHSAVNTTDIDIGLVSDSKLGYNNPGKYPVFLVNGCNAGEYFNNGVNFGEDWMLATEKGARNFIANSSYGFEDALRVYTEYFYKVGFGDSIYLSKGIGDVQKEVARRVLNDFGLSKKYTAQVQQMVLLGDPALRLFAATKPDYSVTDAGTTVISFDGRPIHALTDSIQLQIPTKNLGRSTIRPLVVKVNHTINDIVTTHVREFGRVLSLDTLKFNISRGNGNFFGNNKIEVFIDPDNKIEELREDNNKSSWTKFIQFNGTQNLQPSDFGIVTTTTPTLLFQDTDVLAAEKTYQAQLDTTLAFNSGFLQSKSVKGKVLLKTAFRLLDKDSTVYYWRSKPSDHADDQWETTSFSYIRNGPTGWAQMAFDQMIENSFTSLLPNNDTKKFEYEATSVSIVVKNLGSANTTPGVTGSFQVNNAEYYYSPAGNNCRNNTINGVAFDRSTVAPYQVVPFTFENSFGRACGREPQLINSFTAAETSTGHNDDLIQFVDNIKPGDSVVLFSMGDAGFALWTTDVKTKLGELGIRDTDIDGFIAGEPVIILGRKGAAPGTAKIIRSDQPQPETQELQLTDTLTGRLSNGSMRSVVVGPALQWNSMYPRYRKDNAAEEVGIDVYRVGRDGSEAIVFTNRQNDIDLSGIDASSYPFIKLVFRTEDEQIMTPAVLRSWIVDYKPAPDGLLLYRDSPEVVQVAEGATHTTHFDFVNITSTSFTDSLVSVISVFNRNARTREVREFKIKGPAAGDTTHFSRSTLTTGKAGLNDLTLVVNNSSVTEQYYQNNALDLSPYLEVIRDRFNPVLDVTVDGRYVANGDFVSASPKIVIKLTDENPLLLLKDSTSLNVSMLSPCGQQNCQAKRVSFSSSDVKWNIANNELVFEFTPKNLAAGDYILYAEGRDVSGNTTGPEPYEVSFVVEKENGVTFYPPYPNPSPNGFTFEFTAVGAGPPESFVLTIIDRDGRDIAEFTDENAPAMRVGNNQLMWSGLDARGARLSDGLYFYLLKVKTGESEFKNSGRIMILR